MFESKCLWNQFREETNRFNSAIVVNVNSRNIILVL